MVLRIPATGILTSICAQTEPNQLLKIPYLVAFISSYLSMLFPFIFCANRAIIVFFPKNHDEVREYSESKMKKNVPHFQICTRFMKISLPATVILPCCFTFFMVPAVGHCTQLTAPYPTGAVMFTLDLKVVGGGMTSCRSGRQRLFLKHRKQCMYLSANKRVHSLAHLISMHVVHFYYQYYNVDQSQTYLIL